MSANFEAVLMTDATGMAETEGPWEDIVYTPLGGVARTIKAIVVREVPDIIPNAPRGMTERLMIYVRNSATAGISSASLDVGGDTVTVSRRVGETARVFGVLLPGDGKEWHDAAMLRLQLA